MPFAKFKLQTHDCTQMPFAKFKLQTHISTQMPHSLFFTFSEMKNSKFFSNVNTLMAQLIFPFKPNFCNLFEFPATKSTKKSISFTP
jgi:hypothetical protein